MNIYYCWITAVLSSYQDAIIAGMVHKGYMVGAASKNGVVIFASDHSAPSYLIALSVYKLVDPEKITSTDVYNDLNDVIKKIEAYCYSIVVSQAADCIWVGGNFDIDIKKELAELPPPSDKNMN